MEPIDAQPAVEYVLAGVDAETICGRGFIALRAALANAQRQADDKDMEVYVSVQDRWRVTLPAHPAYPALVVEHNINDDAGRAPRTACAYGHGLISLEFVQEQGFSPDEMQTRTARFEAAQ
jgi:hypothetical protein